MKVLAIETATDACSVALWRNGEVLQRHHIAPRRHADLVLADLEALLAEAGNTLSQLDGIAFGRGPGSFTGVRIATAVTQGIAFGADLPVAPVSTLQAMAQGVMREHDVKHVAAALDARLSEVYFCRYRHGDGDLAAAEGSELLLPPDRIPLPDEKDWYAAGPGFAACERALADKWASVTSALDETRLPQARDVAAIGADLLQRGEGVPAEQALPVYLREQVAQKPSSKTP